MLWHCKQTAGFGIPPFVYKLSVMAVHLFDASALKIKTNFAFLSFLQYFEKIYLKKVVRLIDIFITLFSNRHIVK